MLFQTQSRQHVLVFNQTIAKGKVSMNKNVAVLTSGGDAPGMNAAVRAIVRTGLFHGYEMHGVEMGYEGLVAGNIRKLSARDVGGIMQSAGTFLGSARSVEFTT